MYKKIFFKRPSYQILILCWLALFLGNSYNTFAQKKTKTLPNSQRKKVIKGRNLLNKFKLYEGEKKFKLLVKQNPNSPYFSEALVSIQNQILQIIKVTEEELKEMEPDDSPEVADSTEFSLGDTSKVLKQVVVENDNEKVKITKGENTEKLSKKEKRKAEKEKERQFEKEQNRTEAIVEIDSSILRTETKIIDLSRDFGNTIEDDTTSDERYIGSNYNSDGSIAEEMSDAERAKYQMKKAKQLKDLLLMPYQAYKQQLLANARESSLKFEAADSSSKYLYTYLIDTINVDSALTETAQDKYEVAMDEYTNGNVKLAIQYFKEAIDEQPYYYAAHMGLIDAYQEDKQDSMLLITLKKVASLYPSKTEPLEKISNYFFERGYFDSSAAYLIDAVIIYPQRQFFSKLKEIAKRKGKDYSSQWVEREVYPIEIKNKYEEIIADKESPWRFYQEAKQEMYNYVDTNGIFRGNEKTRERYIEVYAWTRMLDSTYKTEFAFARNMRKMGLLDCYVFITLFHQDLYVQFADLIRRKPDKVKDYFYVLLNWDMEKFERVRRN